MITTLADQYIAQNAGRRYPLADDAGYADIPDDTAILDFRCTVRGVPAGAAPRAWITNVSGTPGKTITVTIDRPGNPDTLDFVIPGNIPERSPFTAAAVDDATGTEGVLTVSTAALAIGNGMKSVPLAWTTVVCDSLKVDSIQSAHAVAEAKDRDDPAGRSAVAVVDGEVLIAEGRNTEPFLDGNRLRLDIFKGGGLGEHCQSAVAGSQRCDTVLFTINGERPGSDGDLRIVGESGIKVIPDPENHAIEIRMDDMATARMAAGCAPACG